MKEKNLFPMKLQFFAEEAPKETSTETPKEEPKEQPNETLKEEPKEQPKNEKDLNVQLQEALVQIAKLKRALDKSTTETSEYKKKYRESLSETEKASQEKAEAEAAKQAEFDEMKRRLAINDLVSEYMDRQFPKDIATKIANARYDGDNDTVNAIEKQMDEVKRKKWESDFLASRPELNAGTGVTQGISKEQFDKMSLIEKSKLRRENQAEYDRLIAL